MHNLPIPAAVAVSLLVGIMLTSAMLPGHLGPNEAAAEEGRKRCSAYGELHALYGRANAWSVSRRDLCRETMRGPLGDDPV